ncbi:head GIN domain-containing protein [Pontibacter silvestris]|uniref:Head GIN domain-containing protein n=1 Tax=Pontibacter silvestris TaxID=2305183 RepID=A0ABW4WVW9_9BACT|nr:head GIN domain-containing protein [Pontibacter silvestris]MCC9138511.1 DUF2807 domain-containing protein [Pontibacter silvestris]
MKIAKSYAIVIFLFALMLSASTPALAQQLRGNGNTRSQTRNVSGFKGIDVSGGFIVELTQGNKESVKLEAEENLLNNIATEVKDGVLHIYNKNSLYSSRAMKAYVTVQELNSIDISGGVKVEGVSTFKASGLSLDMSGGSSVKLALDTKELKADMSGASKLELTGKADKVILDMSGASKVEAADLEAGIVRVEASGASKVKLFAKEALDINASGASVVYYKGTPSITAATSAAARVSKL